MKKIMPVLLLFFLSSSLVAQDNAISKYFGEHLDDPTFEQFKVSEESFDEFADMETDDPLIVKPYIKLLLQRLQGMEIMKN